MIVLDASAMLAFLQGEPGASEVERALDDGAVCGAANWSEVAQKVDQIGGSWSVSRGLLLSYALHIEPVSASDAEAAAALWVARSPLPLGDRLCLALAAPSQLGRPHSRSGLGLVEPDQADPAGHFVVRSGLHRDHTP